MIEHGTTSAYTKHRCRCDACSLAWRDYQREYYRDRVRSGPRRVSADESSEHIDALIAAGGSLAQISEASGVSYKTIKRLARRRQSSVMPGTADAILAVPLGEYVPGRRTTAEKALLLIDHMLESGVMVQEIEATAHIASTCSIRHNRHVRPKTMARLIVLYRYLASQGRVPAKVLEDIS